MLCSITEKFCTIPNQQTNRRILKASCGGKSERKWMEKSSLSKEYEYTLRKDPDLCIVFNV